MWYFVIRYGMRDMVRRVDSRVTLCNRPAARDALDKVGE
jgi:hypothetical protein